MHIYAFGSVCRGEVTLDSDIDLLALVEGHDARFDPSKYSIYSYNKMRELWDNGSPFAWHLALESRLLFTSDRLDFLRLLGQPASYHGAINDCQKFFDVFLEARKSLVRDRNSKVFDLSSIFLSIRNIATCYSLGVLRKPNFSRHAAVDIGGGATMLPLSHTSYRILERARILCTRSIGDDISEAELQGVLNECESIETWMSNLVAKTRDHERVLKSS